MKGYLVSLIIVVIDQASKIKMDQWLGLCVPGQCERFEVLPVFQLAVLYNEGAAFSFLAMRILWPFTHVQPPQCA